MIRKRSEEIDKRKLNQIHSELVKLDKKLQKIEKNLSAMPDQFSDTKMADIKEVLADA